ncbi:MAG: MutS-related protein [Acidimicrobiales bacterium]
MANSEPDRADPATVAAKLPAHGSDVDPSRFHSILFDRSDVPVGDAAGSSDAFADLHLDDVIAAITDGRTAYDLTPFFAAPLGDIATISFRHDVFRDLDGSQLLGCVRTFARQMRLMRDHLGHATRSHYRYEKERWFLDAVDLYCDAVGVLARDLADAEPRSSGFIGLRGYLTSCIDSPGFTQLVDETKQLKSALDAIRYRLNIAGNRIAVSPYGDEPDYSADVLQTFEKFKQGTVSPRQFGVSSWQDMNHVEAAILDRVARLYPEVFASLDEYFTRHQGFTDKVVVRFDREVHFYIAYLEHVERFRAAGLAFCYPLVTDRSKEIRGTAVFDLALAAILVRERGEVVTNDFHLADPERIFVVSGPNQGGKTTFARTIGQLHHLARIGVPVPGSSASLFLVDRIFTHFEREENLQNLSGKLEDDLRRIHEIIGRATPRSLLVMNESFSSTTVSDSLFLNKAVMRQIVERDLICVTVTFLDELASLGPTTVSMVSTVEPGDLARRTFRIVRQPADGLAYAWAIAEKYQLAYRDVKRRILR